MDPTEKPLEIVLDYTSRGLASPKFIFKSPLATTGVPLTPHRIKHFTCGGGREGGGGLEFSADYGHTLSQQDHHDSVNSLSSAVSGGSNKSKKSKSVSSLVTKDNKLSLIGDKKSPARDNKKSPIKQMSLPNQNSPPPCHTPSSLSRFQLSVQQDTPSCPTSSKPSRSKAAVVSSFFSRSLRGQRKHKSMILSGSPHNSLMLDNNNNEQEEEVEDGEIQVAMASVLSPRASHEKKFTLSTVMHIYFTEGKQAQVYKSVLVSEKATTKELIGLALERYNMKDVDPSSFALFDVIGKWQEVAASTSKSQLQHHGNVGRGGVEGGGGRIKAASTLPNMNMLTDGTLSQHCAAVEEFVECYRRELEPDESPYKMQFYLAPQEGFTRRFELQSKSTCGDKSDLAKLNERSHSAAMERPNETTPTQPDGEDVKKSTKEENDFEGIFGDTLYRKRARRNRILNLSSVGSADPDISITILDSPREEIREVRGVSSGGGEEKMDIVRESHRGHTDEREDSDIPISINTSFAPNFSTAGCSSPDSGVEFQKRALQSGSNKSSISSEQSDASNIAIISNNSPSEPALCPGNFDSAILLSLRLSCPHREQLIYRLNNDSTQIFVKSADKIEMATPLSPLTNDTIFLVSSERVQEGQLCSICRSLASTEPDSTPKNQEHMTNIRTNLSCARYNYKLQRVHSKLSLQHNGQEISDSVLLRHGDLLSIGDTYHFMFQDYTAANRADENFNMWKSRFISSMPDAEEKKTNSNSEEVVTKSDSKSILKTSHSFNENSAEGTDHDRQDGSTSRKSEVFGNDGPFQAEVEITTIKQVSCRMGNLQEPQKLVVAIASPEEESGETSLHSSLTDTPTVTYVPISASTPKEELEPTSPVAARRNPFLHSARSSHRTKADRLKSTRHQMLGKTRSLPLPRDRKLVFSFKTTEEDKLINHIIWADLKLGSSISSHSPCKLAPAYILAMCTEYSIMSNSPEALMRFVQKSIDRIQEVVWVSP